MEMEFEAMRKPVMAILAMGLGTAFSQENTNQQSTATSIAPTMPVPKLPYNMPSTRVNAARYAAEMSRSVNSAREQREVMEQATAANRIAKPEMKRSEYLKWSETENTLHVTVKEGEGGRGLANEGSQPVGALLGARAEDLIPSASVSQVSQDSGPATASAKPIAQAVGPAPIAPVPPQYGQSPVGGIGTSIPQPVTGVSGPIPQPDMFIKDAGGIPQQFEPPPAPELPQGVEVAPATVPATPQPTTATTERKRGFFGKIFGGKRQRNETPPVDTSNYITTGPEITAPVAPSVAATAADESKKEFVIVKAEQGTQFVIAGDTANGQSGILVPLGTVLQRLGLNGRWTTVKSPNGTTGSVQNVDIRDANFDEAIQFISSSAQ